MDVTRVNLKKVKSYGSVCSAAKQFERSIVRDRDIQQKARQLNRNSVRSFFAGRQCETPQPPAYTERRRDLGENMRDESTFVDCNREWRL